MDHIAEFKKLAGDVEDQFELYLFGWFDPQGNSGDYGLNSGEASKTFSTLINTTYMFQPHPKFTLQCRPFKMTMAQFEYLQEHDLDTEAFLSQLGPLPEVSHKIDLGKFQDATSAMSAMNALLS